MRQTSREEIVFRTADVYGGWPSVEVSRSASQPGDSPGWVLTWSYYSAAGFKLGKSHRRQCFVLRPAPADDYLTRYEGPEAVNKNQANIYTAVRYFRWSLLSVGVLVVVVCFAAELWCFNERLGVWKKTHVGGASIQLKNWWALAAYEAIYVYQLGALIVSRGPRPPRNIAGLFLTTINRQVWCCWIFNNG